MALARIPAPDSRSPIDVAAFTAGISGTVIRPEDPAFDAARHAHNRRFDRRPSLIVQAASSADVARTVVFAREHDLDLAVRGGSHSLAGHSTTDGGTVLDLGGMKGLHIDVERRLAWAQPGLTAGEYTAAAAAHGLATPFGDTASVGIAGLTLGGGIGWLARKHGLTIDALVSVDIVTADGRLLTASADEHADLFWAIRGGGGNFGVVTRFQYRLYPVDQILGGALFMPVTREVLRSLVPIAAAAPEELTTISYLMAAPPAPFIPAEHQGKPTLAIMFVYAGDPEAGMKAIEPFRQVATPLAEMVAPMPYPGIYEFTKEGEEPGPYIVRSTFLDTLDDAAINSIIEHTAAPSSPYAMTEIRVLGGAMGRVPATATAFAHRNSAVMLALITPFEDRSEAPVHEAWTVEYFDTLRGRATGVYANFISDEDPARIRDAYPAPTHLRLAQVKRRYDPGNLFRLNQNIRPAATS